MMLMSERDGADRRGRADRQREILSVQNTSGYYIMKLLIIAVTFSPRCKAGGN